MRTYAKSAAVIATALGLMSCQTTPHPAPRDVALAIANVTVIDPESRRVMADRTVFIDGERIVAVLPAKRAGSHKAARTIDARGKFLIPGLVDMHAHLFLPEPATPSLNLFLANGVTGIREMSSDCWAAAGAKKGCVADYRALQTAVKSGATPGPELLSLTSTMVMGPTRLKLPKTAPAFITPRDAAEAKLLVEYLAGRGTDLIKTHDSIPAAAFAAMMAEANRRGLKVGGHVPFAAGSLGAGKMGYRSIEHARDLLYDCSSYGPLFRAQEAAAADQQPGAVRPKNMERLTRTVAEYDAARCAAMLSALAKQDVYYVPTHVTREMEAKAGDAVYRAQIPRRFMLAARNANWEKDLAETIALPAAERDALGAFFRHGLMITGLAYRAGIQVMVGTDSNDTMIVPGFSLHRELALLVEAGLPPMEALRAATTVPARYFGTTATQGGIAAGKEADLVLLDANPLTAIRNSGAVHTVISNGRVHDRAALDALLAEVEAMARKP